MPRPALSFADIKDPDLRNWYRKAFDYLYDSGLSDWFMSMVNRFYEHEESMKFYVRPFSCTSFLSFSCPLD